MYQIAQLAPRIDVCTTRC